MSDLGELPFAEKYRADILAGIKITTVRRSRHGQVGDTFHAFGHTFRVIRITECKLADALFFEHKQTLERTAEWAKFTYPQPGQQARLAPVELSDRFEGWVSHYGKDPKERDPLRLVYLHHFAYVARDPTPYPFATTNTAATNTVVGLHQSTNTTGTNAFPAQLPQKRGAKRRRKARAR